MKNFCLELRLDPYGASLENEAIEFVYREVSRQFPKTCGCCNKIYRTDGQFTRETEICGPATNHDFADTILFQRNCPCKTTLAIGINYNQFDEYEQHALFGSMKALGTLAIEAVSPAIVAGKDIADTPLSKFIKGYLEEREIARIVRDIMANKVTKCDKLHVGLNVFRTRYNDWVGKKEAVHPVN